MNNLAFLIGCEEYSEENIPNLNGVNNDVASMSCALINNCSCLPEQVFIITDQPGSICSPTGTGILNLLIQKATEFSQEQIDNLFFYFSGHGCLSPNNEVCLLPKDSMIQPIQHGILTQEKIVLALKQFERVKHIILFLDICLNELVPKGSIDARTVNPDYFPKGSIIFYSCFPRNVSYMIPDIGISKYGSGSVFTKCLVESFQPQNGCRNVNEISNFLKVKVLDLSKELGFDQKPFTQLQDASLGEVVITNHVKNNSINLSEEEQKQVADFAEKIDIDNPNICILFGSTAEAKLSNYCVSISQFLYMEKNDKIGPNELRKRTDLNALIQDIEDFSSILSEYKKSIRRRNLLTFSDLFGRVPKATSFTEVEIAKRRFFEHIENHQRGIMWDTSVLDHSKTVLCAHVKETWMYIYSAELAIKKQAGKETDVLMVRISNLRNSIQEYEHLCPFINEYQRFLTNLLIQLQNVLRTCDTSIERINLLLTNEDMNSARSLIDDIIDQLILLQNRIKAHGRWD